jgi:hypothetical protein
MKIRYLSIFFTLTPLLLSSCDSFKKSTLEENKYLIYTEIIDEFSESKTSPWLNGNEIPSYILDDTLSSKNKKILKEYLHNRDSLNLIQRDKIFYVTLNDSTFDFKDDLATMRYAIYRDKTFFKKYLDSDSSFKDIPVKSKSIHFEKERIQFDKIKTKYRYKIYSEHNQSKPQNEVRLTSIMLSKIYFNENQDRAILEVIDQSSSTIYCLIKSDNSWKIKSSILNWII